MSTILRYMLFFIKPTAHPSVLSKPGSIPNAVRFTITLLSILPDITSTIALQSSLATVTRNPNKTGAFRGWYNARPIGSSASVAMGQAGDGVTFLQHIRIYVYSRLCMCASTSARPPAPSPKPHRRSVAGVWRRRCHFCVGGRKDASGRAPVRG